MNPVPPQAPPRRGIILALALGTLALFARSVGFEFVVLDDPKCVFEEPMITAGLSWEGFVWSFKSIVVSHWKPLVNLSHQLDCELFGLNPGPHHAVNVAWHAATTVMVFLALERLTGATWRSALVAALFAWHPLRVESVAWVTERKDVLSGFLAMATLWAYAGYAERPDLRRYGMVAGLFVLGLLAKSSLVTLPFVMLLLDFWPLGRLRLGAAPSGGDGAIPKVPVHKLVLEKVPLFALTFAVSLVAVWVAAASEGIMRKEFLPLTVRLGNAAVSIAKYLGATFWPANLSCMYPYKAGLPTWTIVAAVILLLAITCIAIRERMRRPFIAVGWFWFLGMLVPMLGFIQAGAQAMADRYTYLPHIGLFIALVWTAAGFLPAIRREVWTPVVAIVLAVMAAATFVELQYWRDSRTLFQRALVTTRDNWFIHAISAELDLSHGQPASALQHLSKAVALQPDEPLVRFLLARAHIQSGRTDEARVHVQAAFSRVRREGSTERELLTMLGEATATHPKSADLHFVRATALATAGLWDESADSLRRVLELAPSTVDAYVDLGVIRATQRRPAESIAHYKKALELNAAHPVALANLGGLLADSGELAEGLKLLAQAVQLQPANTATRYNLALALLKAGRHAEAIDHLRGVLRQQPDHANALNRLAWLLATSSEDSVRNGADALAFAARLQQLTGRKQPMAFDTEAAALAECGRFDEAVAAARQGLGLAENSKQAPLAAAIAQRLKNYEGRQPHRESTARGP